MKIYKVNIHRHGVVASLGYDKLDGYFYGTTPGKTYPNTKTMFTKQWLKDNWEDYEYFNNAGFLEFVEVKE